MHRRTLLALALALVAAGCGDQDAPASDPPPSSGYSSTQQPAPLGGDSLEVRLSVLLRAGGKNVDGMQCPTPQPRSGRVTCHGRVDGVRRAYAVTVAPDGRLRDVRPAGG